MPPDPWAALRATTRARIGLGRTGDAPPLRHLLDFQLAHARARDAVHTPLDTAAIAQALAPLPTVTVRSQAADRATYLRRPDLGRQLDPASHGALTGIWDVVFVIADGLSPVGVGRHAAPLLRACLARLPGWSVAPVVIATQARVALGDDIGARLDAQLCAMLIGERPGLSVADSLGVYLTYQPRPGRRDAQRNCISNIHQDGLSYDAAADMLAWLMTEARARKLTGVELKDDRPAVVTAERPSSLPAPAAHPSA
ncbi:ethanolamine ammonia-lyase subunit EutC [Rhodopila sp.]|uniref:ethanolamine ammonia-lyase subunit EutC n=1 Tax=Rhodopila sp. TaxID=2480087 RepID=UPI003D0D5CDD